MRIDVSCGERKEKRREGAHKLGIPTGLVAQAMSVCRYRQFAQWREGFLWKNGWGQAGVEGERIIIVARRVPKML